MASEYEIVRRLRELPGRMSIAGEYAQDCHEAAELIEALAAALEFYGWGDHWVRVGYERTICEEDRGFRARAALAKLKGNNDE